jgi:hypothetical protein
VLTPLSYFTRKKERKETEILLTTDASYNSRNPKFINGLKNIQDTYHLINKRDKISKGHAVLQINLRISAFSYVRGDQRAVNGFRGAFPAVGEVLGNPEKLTYSCKFQCIHVLVMTPGQRV